MSELTLHFSPFIDPWIIWVLAAFSTLLLVVFLFHRFHGGLLRGLGMALVVLALFNPNLIHEEREPLSNIVVVLVDQSPSQIIAGREALIAQVKKNLLQQLGTLQGLDVELLSLKGDQSGSEDGTMVFGHLRDALSRLPANRVAGVVVISDGQIHDAPTHLADLGLDVPVHTLLTGNKQEFDRRIEIVKAPRYGLVGAKRTVTVKIVEQGTIQGAGQPVKLSVRQKGEKDWVQFVGIGEEIAVPFQFPHAGMNLMELEVEVDDAEITSANNKAVVSAEGVRENLRVLLVSGEPHSGERTWRNLLKSDASVDLVHFTILRPPEKQDGTPIHQLSLIAFPTRELFSEKLTDFDLIIFDRYQRRGVLPLHYLDNVARYVKNGGAVLIAAGDKFAGPLSLANTPLEKILPALPTGQVVEKPYRAQITDQGQRHPVTHKLPRANGLKSDPQWGRWFRVLEARVNDGDVLMTGAEQHPLLVLNRLGKGRVALLLSDHTWLWARSFDGGGPYKILLRRLSHWLMKEPDLEEEALQATSKGRSLVVTRRTMKEKIAPVRITQPDGAVKEIELTPSAPGTWQAILKDQKLGIHRVKSGDLNALAFIGFASQREMKDIVTTDKVMAPLAKEAQSGLFWTGDGKGDLSVFVPKVSLLNRTSNFAGPDWMALRDRQAYVVKDVQLIPLFTGLIALALLLLTLGSLWYREGR